MSDQSTRNVGVFTSRAQERGVFRAGGYEYEDCITTELDPGILVADAPGATQQAGFRMQRALARKGLPGLMVPGLPARTTTLEADLTLLFAVPSLARDLLGLGTIRDWRARTGFAVCHLQELWVAEFDMQLEAVEPILNQFDHVFCTMYETAEALGRRLSVPVSYLPWGVDAEKMCPLSHVGGQGRNRVIDVASVGKIDEITHQGLWDWADRTGRLYDFTTTGGDRMSVPHQIHRDRLTQTLTRAKYFFTFLAKREFMGQRGAQREFGLRYLEGAAAGTLQLGEPVSGNPGYEQHLDWDGAVLEVPFSTPDMGAIIEELERDSARLERIRRDNVINCLRRHDYVYRWREVLRLAGLPETPAMAERCARLEALATRVTQEGMGAASGLKADAT